MVEWWSGGVVEWWSGGVVEWWSGGVVEWWSGRVGEWASRVRIRDAEGIRACSRCVDPANAGETTEEAEGNSGGLWAGEQVNAPITDHPGGVAAMRVRFGTWVKGSVGRSRGKIRS